MFKYLVLIGAALQLIGIYSYGREVIKGNAKPNRITWLLWSIAPMIATAAGLVSGAGWAVLPVFMSGFGPLLIFVLSLFNKQSYWKLEPFDYLCGFFSLLALILWAITKEPMIAIFFAIVSDFFAGVPTLIKSWKHPETENVTVYFTGALSALTSFAAIKIWGFSELAFPIYLILMDSALVFSIIYKHRVLSREEDRLARIIWDYHHLNHQLKKSDCIFVLGSHDLSVPKYAAELYLEGYAPFIIFSGGLGRFTSDVFNKPEAEVFADIAISLGVPKDKIIIENKATNTGENVALTKKLLFERNLDFKDFILVQKPYMERRTFATFKKLWPEKEFIVTSPNISYKNYTKDPTARKNIISIIVGDMQRIKVYSEKGFQIYQEIPKDVWAAYEKLVELGFTQHLIKD